MPKLPMPFQRWTTYPGHSGVDFPQPKGTPIRASANGFVSQISYSDTGGWRVWVRYAPGTLKYCHMDTRADILVNLRDSVAFGQPIARVDKLGNASGNIPASTGYHLHLENAARAGFEGVWEIVDRKSWLREDEEMALNADTDYEAFKTMLARALRFDVRPQGAGTDPSLGFTLWERLDRIQAGVNGMHDASADKIASELIKQGVGAEVAREIIKQLSA